MPNALYVADYSCVASKKTQYILFPVLYYSMGRSISSGVSNEMQTAV